MNEQDKELIKNFWLTALIIVLIGFFVLTFINSKPETSKPDLVINYPKKEYVVITKSPIGITTNKETLELANPEVEYRWGRYVLWEKSDSHHRKIVKEVPVGWYIILKPND